MRVNIGTKEKVQINISSMKEESFYVAFLQHVHKMWTNTATLPAPAFIFCLFFFSPEGI